MVAKVFIKIQRSKGYANILFFSVPSVFIPCIQLVRNNAPVTPGTGSARPCARIFMSPADHAIRIDGKGGHKVAAQCHPQFRFAFSADLCKFCSRDKNGLVMTSSARAPSWHNEEKSAAASEVNQGVIVGL